MRKMMILLGSLSIIFPALLAEALPEYTIKSAYLYNFALLTDWPDRDSDDFKLCFYKEDLGAASDILKTKTIHEKQVSVTIVASPEEARECQMLFIRESEVQSGGQLIRALSGSPVLIVSETPEIADSHITILQERRKLAFDVSLKSLKKTDLVLSSRLLKLARKVDP